MRRPRLKRGTRPDGSLSFCTSLADGALVVFLPDGGSGLSMTAKRTAKPFVGVSWSDQQVRQHSAGALRYAMNRAGATQAEAAKWCRVSVRTIADWLAGRAPINLRAVLRSGRLRREFIRYLRVCDLKEAA